MRIEVGGEQAPTIEEPVFRFSQHVLEYEPSVPELRPDIIGPALQYEQFLLTGETPPPITDPELRRSIRWFQYGVVYLTFMASEGRQPVQGYMIDQIARYQKEQALYALYLDQDPYVPDLQTLASPQARHMMRGYRVPRYHVPVPSDQEEGVFDLWGQNALWLTDSVWNGTSRLPKDHEFEWFYKDYLKLNPEATTSFTMEEVSGLKVMFERFRTEDPNSLLTAEEALRRFALPAIVEADSHWLANHPNPSISYPGRSRPAEKGPLDTVNKSQKVGHKSAIRTLIPMARKMYAEGKPLYPAHIQWLQMGDMLDAIGRLPGGYERWFPEYHQLNLDYNQWGFEPQPVRALHIVD